MFRGGRSSAVPAVIVAIYNQTGSHQDFDQIEVPSDVLTETMGDLDDAAGGYEAIPPGARNGQAICAGKLEFIRTSHRRIHTFWPPTQVVNYAQFESHSSLLELPPVQFAPRQDAAPFVLPVKWVHSTCQS